MHKHLCTITITFIPLHACSYFKINGYYGMSCFEKISVSSIKERGARMKSVGVLAHTYRHLHIHREFLQRQVRYGSVINL